MSRDATNACGTRKVLVTGGGSGIGRAVAEALLAGGGRVALVGRRPEALASVLAGRTGSVAIVCDLRDPQTRSGLVTRAARALDGLDGFVHSAGVVAHEPLGGISEEALCEQLEVNLVAPLRLGEEALRLLEPGGAIVLVASTLALRPVATSAVYSAAKAGLLALARTLAVAGAGRGIRANAVSPGVVDTDMIDRARVPSLVPLHPLGRLGTPAEVAQAVVHLLAAPWTTGTNFVVDGGLLARE